MPNSSSYQAVLIFGSGILHEGLLTEPTRQPSPTTRPHESTTSFLISMKLVELHLLTFAWKQLFVVTSMDAEEKTAVNVVVLRRQPTCPILFRLSR